jgi:lipoprotein-anchoring transpeptidase ErfK/SrfK
MKMRTFFAGLAISIMAPAIFMFEMFEGQESPPATSAPTEQRGGDKPSADKPGAKGEAGDSSKAPLRLPLVNARLVVTKSKRRLTLYSDGQALRVYRVGLGFNPVDDKTRQGDGCTPEGSFYVCVKNANSRYYLSLGLSYPNKEHADRGLRDRIITRSEHGKILSALERRARPPWDTGLGGEVFIHGRGSQSDWTFGCVALDDEDMKELFDAIPKGTPVLIEA